MGLPAFFPALAAYSVGDKSEKALESYSTLLDKAESGELRMKGDGVKTMLTNMATWVAEATPEAKALKASLNPQLQTHATGAAEQARVQQAAASGSGGTLMTAASEPNPTQKPTPRGK